MPCEPKPAVPHSSRPLSQAILSCCTCMCGTQAAGWALPLIRQSLAALTCSACSCIHLFILASLPSFVLARDALQQGLWQELRLTCGSVSCMLACLLPTCMLACLLPTCMHIVGLNCWKPARRGDVRRGAVCVLHRSQGTTLVSQALPTHGKLLQAAAAAAAGGLS
jgi:hypothetical protein